MTKIVVFDYGAGNVHSACHALERVGAKVKLTDDSKQVLNADGVLVPGVGAFGYVMDRFRRHNGPDLISERLTEGGALFGVCVGMQIMFQSAQEKGSYDGLGLFSGSIDVLKAQCLPNMGWSKVAVGHESRMFNNIEDEYFYFVHSYARGIIDGSDGDSSIKNLVNPVDPVVTTLGNHGGRFAAAIESGNIWATQFHPEKSGSAGLSLLSNWVGSLK